MAAGGVLELSVLVHLELAPEARDRHLYGDDVARRTAEGGLVQIV